MPSLFVGTFRHNSHSYNGSQWSGQFHLVLDPEHLFLFILTSLSLELRWSRSKVDKMGLSRLGENWDLSTDFHCDFPLWASLVALWSPNVSDRPQLFSCLLNGVVAPRPIVLYGPLMVFYGSPRVLPRDLGGVETPAQRRITRSSPPSSHSLNFTLSLNAISPDLPRSFPSAHKETPLKRIIFFKNRLGNILKCSRGGILSKVALCILWTQC